jgi:glycosyltransferase involved in cell wall biosynthesis
MRAKRLLVLDSSYCLEAIRERSLEESVTSRDLDGYFEHVWTVHPFASLVSTSNWGPKFGPPTEHFLGGRHTFIEGKVGRFKSLRRVPGINFLYGQTTLLLSLVHLIRKQQISVVRAGDPLYLGLLGWMLARLTQIPLVIRVGGNNEKVYELTGRPIMPRLFGSRTVERRVERFVLSRADLVAGANQNNLDFAVASGAKPGRTTLFRYGNLIDPAHFSPPETRGGDALVREQGISPREFLLFIGRLESVKRVDHVIKVVAKLRELGHQVALLIVGDGSMRIGLEELATRLGIRPAVVFAGNRDQAWLAKVIPLAAAVVSPHTGRALAEAALGGTPIVAYDVDWQGELVKSGQTGQLVPEDDWEAMAEAVALLLTNREYALQLGSNIRKSALAMMDRRLLTENEIAAYEKLLNG